MTCAPPAPWVMAAYARENDIGCRCAPRRSGRAHRRGGGSCCARRSCASLSRAAGAAGFGRTGLGATRQSEGLRRVRGRAHLRTPGPAPSGRSQTSNPSRNGVSSAASRRRSTCWPTGSPRAFPHGIAGPERPAGEVGMVVPCRISSMPHEASKQGGLSGHIRRLPRATAARLTVAQLQAGQRYVEPAACPVGGRFRVRPPLISDGTLAVRPRPRPSESGKTVSRRARVPPPPNHLRSTA